MSVAIFFFNDTATTEIYTLSLHDALPISIARSSRASTSSTPSSVGGGAPSRHRPRDAGSVRRWTTGLLATLLLVLDRKSTRLNSSHANISYAVFCLKKKKYNHRAPNITLT